jgi:ADP-heptose:LPS heptosyltransferase
MAERILLIQLRRIGDVLMTTPAVAALRAARPAAHLSFLTEAPSDQVYRHNPHVDEVLVWPHKASLAAQLRFAWALRRGRPDVVVDFFGNPRSALVTRFTGAPRRIGWDFRGRGRAYSEKLDWRGRLPYSADHKAALVEPLGAHVSDLTPRVFPGAAEREQAAAILARLGVGPTELFVVICPVSRRSYRTWPAERFGHLCDVLIERYGAKVLIFYGPGEDAVAGAVRAAMTHPALPDPPDTDLLTMAALFERAHLFVGNDGGPHHFAVAVGIPTLTIFGKDFARTWTPPGQSLHRTVEHDPGCKSACHYPRCGEECINDLSFGQVERALESYLKELLRDGRPVRRQPAGGPA